MKMSAKNRIIIWSAVSLVLVAALIGGMIFVNDYGYSLFESEMVEVGSAEFSASDIKSLDISWESGQIYISNTYENTDKITVTEYWDEDLAEKYDRDNLYYDLKDDGTLKIESDSSFYYSLIGLKTEEKNLKIQIPYGTELDSLNIDAGNSYVSVSGIKSGSLDVEGTANDAEITDVYADTLNIETVSGDITLTGGKYDEIRTETVSGGCWVQSESRIIECSDVSGNIYTACGRMTEKLDAENVSGSVECTISDLVSGYTVNMSTVSGNTDCNYNNAKSENGSVVSGDGSAQIDIVTVSGDISIQETDYDEYAEEGTPLDIDISTADEVNIEYNDTFISSGDEEYYIDSGETEKAGDFSGFLEDLSELIEDSEVTYDCYDYYYACSVELINYSADGETDTYTSVYFMKSCIEVYSDNHAESAYYCFDGYDLKNVLNLFESYFGDIVSYDDGDDAEETDETEAVEQGATTESTDSTSSAAQSTTVKSTDSASSATQSTTVKSTVKADSAD
ncbi:MAG: DUF4097 family beta strand repeat-containing protein [Clostridiales bacterium]|nr:DUF4097 family beta strand repeat-containing protein [Clostridiales bacterium]